MDIFITNVVVIITYIVPLIFVTLGPLLVVPVAIWIRLWLAEVFFSAFPLGTGKPAAWVAQKLRGLYTKLIGKLWGLFAKFATNIGKGLKKLLKKGSRWFFPRVWRGLKRLVKKGKERLWGNSTPPPTSSSPP